MMQDISRQTPHGSMKIQHMASFAILQNPFESFFSPFPIFKSLSTACNIQLSNGNQKKKEKSHRSEGHWKCRFKKPILHHGVALKMLSYKEISTCLCHKGLSDISPAELKRPLSLVSEGQACEKKPIPNHSRIAYAFWVRSLQQIQWLCVA